MVGRNCLSHLHSVVLRRMAAIPPATFVCGILRSLCRFRWSLARQMYFPGSVRTLASALGLWPRIHFKPELPCHVKNATRSPPEDNPTPDVDPGTDTISKLLKSGKCSRVIRSSPP